MIAVYERATGIRLAGDAIDASGPPSGVASDDVRRRTLVTFGVTTALASLSGVPNDEGHVGHIGRADVERLDHGAVRLRNLGHLHGGEGLWLSALDLASRGYRMLEQGRYTETVGEDLQRAIGRAQMCAGWLAFDAGHQDVARSCFNEALSLARQTDDPVVETHALVNLAFQSNILGMPRQALRFADAADRAAREADGSSRISVVPQLRRAVAYATSGDVTASRAAIGDARRELDRGREAREVPWADFVSHAELDGVEGTCALRFGDPELAEQKLANAIAGLSGKFKRNRALYSVRLAAARIDQSSPDGAAEAAISALDDLAGELSSHVVSGELQAVAGRLRGHRSVLAVNDFLTRYHLTATKL